MKTPDGFIEDAEELTREELICLLSHSNRLLRDAARSLASFARSHAKLVSRYGAQYNPTANVKIQFNAANFEEFARAANTYYDILDYCPAPIEELEER